VICNRLHEFCQPSTASRRVADLGRSAPPTIRRDVVEIATQRTGGSVIDTYPWGVALDEVDRLAESHPSRD
jgi:hypothetical protein